MPTQIGIPVAPAAAAAGLPTPPGNVRQAARDVANTLREHVQEDVNNAASSVRRRGLGGAFRSGAARFQCTQGSKRAVVATLCALRLRPPHTCWHTWPVPPPPPPRPPPPQVTALGNAARDEAQRTINAVGPQVEQHVQGVVAKVRAPGAAAACAARARPAASAAAATANPSPRACHARPRPASFLSPPPPPRPQPPPPPRPRP
jgi:hypothetical protein